MGGSGAEGEDFGVCGWVIQAFCLIVAPSDNESILNNHRTDWHFTFIIRLLGFAERLLHEEEGAFVVECGIEVMHVRESPHPSRLRRDDLP